MREQAKATNRETAGCRSCRKEIDDLRAKLEAAEKAPCRRCVQGDEYAAIRAGKREAKRDK